MTNAEKFKEVFGFEPDKSSCPTVWCIDCPLRSCDSALEWWDSEYKGLNKIRK